MYCYCRDEFDWLMKMLEKGNCFSDYEDLNNFIDDGLLKLRYEKYQDKYVKDTKNILKKIKLVKPEIYNSDEFYEVLYSEEFDEIEVEEDIKNFYKQVKKYVLDEIKIDEIKIDEIKKYKIKKI